MNFAELNTITPQVFLERMNDPQLRERCAQRLLAVTSDVSHLTAFIGLDGVVDEIVHVVDQWRDAETFERVPTIAKFAERLAAAAGKSTNVELVNHLTKLGGNGPILANALATFGFKVTYVGSVGYPEVHPIFADFANRTEVFSIAEPNHTDAIEFDDGKIMLGKMASAKEVNWATIQSRFGKEKFANKFSTADLVGFMSWTMLPHMNAIWEAVLKEICPAMTGKRRTMFFDLADPQKRKADDIRQALKLITDFEKYLDVILGLNEKEAFEIAAVLGLEAKNHSREGLCSLANDINRLVPVNTLVIHPVDYALATSKGVGSVVEGPLTLKPHITTGGGDHFNAGFCLGRLLGFDNALSLLTGVTTSGYYVRTGRSPVIGDLIEMLKNWPTK